MASTDRKAPTGKWEPPKPEIGHALGCLVMAWSLIETTLEVCIWKQTDLTPLSSSIFTAGMQFKARLATLRSQLHRFPKDPKTKRALKVLDEIAKVQDRNDIMHSIIGGSTDMVWFMRRITASHFSSKIENYDKKRLLDAALKCSTLAADLMNALGVTKDDYLHFCQNSHNAANSL